MFLFFFFKNKIVMFLVLLLLFVFFLNQYSSCFNDDQMPFLFWHQEKIWLVKIFLKKNIYTNTGKETG